MSWNKGNYSKNDFSELFERQNLNAFELASLENIVDDVKQNSSKFTELIILPVNQPLLFGLFDIALRPFQSPHQASITIKTTNNAIQILGSLSQQFTEVVFFQGAKKATDDDEVIQEETEQLESTTVPIISKMTAILFSSKPVPETALSYFVRLMTPLLYQKSQEMVDYLTSNPELRRRLSAYFGSISISELICKLLEVENQGQFFEPLKITILKELAATIRSEAKEEDIPVMLENYAGLLDLLHEKHEDKFDRAKFTKLVNDLVNQHSLFEFITLQNPRTRRENLLVMGSYLKFSGNQNTAAKNADNSDNETNEVKLNEDVLAMFCKAIHNYDIKKLRDLSRLELICFYKVVKSMSLNNRSFLTRIFTGQFVQSSLQLMLAHPRSDILHNLQKDIFIEALKQCEMATAKLLLTGGFIGLMLDNIHERLSVNCYENQLFLVACKLMGCAKSAGYQNVFTEEVVNKIANKKLFYEKLIGGDPDAPEEDQWNEDEVVLQTITGNQLVEGVLSLPILVMSEEIKMEIDDGPISTALDHFIDYEMDLPLNSDDEQTREKIHIEPRILLNSELFSAHLALSVEDIIREMV